MAPAPGTRPGTTRSNGTDCPAAWTDWRKKKQMSNPSPETISDSFQNKGQRTCHPRPVLQPPWLGRWLCANLLRETQASRSLGLQLRPCTTTESANPD